MTDIAINVANLNKVYPLYKKPTDRVKEAFNFFGKKYHTEFNAVKDISFTVNKGETVGIIGRNGCGKSTLLKMITSVLTPSSGQIHVNGQISAILELGSGFNIEMSGLENIYFSNTVNGISRGDTKQKLEQILSFADLGEFIHQPIKVYSSGMIARLAFAVAINIDPDILIIDEALSVGDTAFQRKCFAKMEEIRANGTTILFVSHSEASIVSLCNRAIWLSHGEQILDGEPKLVTGLYLKYSGKKAPNKNKILNEYASLSNNKKTNAKANNLKPKKNIEDGNISAFFNPNLKPKSTIYYEEKGAKIIDVFLTTLDGKKINVLVQENNYIIKMQFELYKDMSDVRLGISIKDIKGHYLSGAAFEFLKHKQIEKIPKGMYCVEWDFHCSIVDGIFVTDVVILNDFNSKKIIANKINDSCLFKVLNYEKNNIIQSHVPMIKSCIYYEIT